MEAPTWLRVVVFAVFVVIGCFIAYAQNGGIYWDLGWIAATGFLGLMVTLPPEKLEP